MSRRNRRAAGWATAALAIAVQAPGASAAPTWLAPSPLGAASADPAVGTGAGGDAVAAWVDDGGRVVASVRPAGGGFGPPQVLGTAGSAYPQVAVAEDGSAVVAWRQESGAVAYATRPAGGAVGAAATLADGVSATAVRVAAATGGEAVIAFAGPGAQVALGSTGGSFGAPQVLTSGSVCGLAADMADSGHAAVAWHACGGGAAGAARRAPAGSFGAAEDLGSAAAVDVAVEEDGRTLAALEQGEVVRIADATPGAAFGGPVAVSGAGARQPVIAAGGGEVWAAWRQGTRVTAARRPAGGSFQGAATVSAEGAEGPPRIGAGRTGAVTLTWLRAGDAGLQVEAAHRPAGEPALAPAAALAAGSVPAGGAALSVDGDGNAVASYLRDGQAVAHPLDAAGPRPLGIQLPEVGYARDTYSFSFGPADAWSAVAGARIDFGDGAVVEGTRADHAYASAGEKAVTFSATDAVGNTGAAVRPFRVAPPADRTAPVIRRARMDAYRFRVSGKPTPIAAAVRRGTRFRYRLSEPAQATLFFERVRMGRRRGGTCERGRRRGRLCRVYEPVGLITRTHPTAGRVSTAFSGRIVGYQGRIKLSDVRLRPGRYRATIVAADAARNASKPVMLAFTVLR